MSSMSASGTAERSMASRTAILPSSNASTSTSEPLCDRPMGVRAPATMTASVMVCPLVGSLWFGSLRVEADGPVEAHDVAVDVAVGDQVLGQPGELVGSPEPSGERHLGLERVAHGRGRLLPG